MNITNEHVDENVASNVLNEYMRNDMKEKKRNNTLSFLLKFSFLIYLLVAFFGVIYIMNPGIMEKITSDEHLALIKIIGDIGEDGENSSSIINEALVRAFKNKSAKAVVIEINSGGGSPYTSSVIYDNITKLKNKYNKKVYAVINETGASGAYYIASSADEIYAHKNSIVGSIGVRMGSFGFEDIMSKAGIKRRVISSGDNKTIGDMFAPMTKEQEVFLKKITKDIHEQFISDVKAGRGTRLKADQTTFSGLFWIGTDALKMGLIDGYNTVDTLNNDSFNGIQVFDYTKKSSGIFDLFKPRISMEMSLKGQSLM
jgi:protease-4